MTADVLHRESLAEDTLLGRAHIPLAPLLQEACVEGRAGVFAVLPVVDSPRRQERVQVGSLLLVMALEEVTSQGEDRADRLPAAPAAVVRVPGAAAAVVLPTPPPAAAAAVGALAAAVEAAAAPRAEDGAAAVDRQPGLGARLASRPGSATDGAGVTLPGGSWGTLPGSLQGDAGEHQAAHAGPAYASEPEPQPGPAAAACQPLPAAALPAAAGRELPPVGTDPAGSGLGASAEAAPGLEAAGGTAAEGLSHLLLAVEADPPSNPPAWPASTSRDQGAAAAEAGSGALPEHYPPPAGFSAHPTVAAAVAAALIAAAGSAAGAAAQQPAPDAVPESPVTCNTSGSIPAVTPPAPQPAAATAAPAPALAAASLTSLAPKLPAPPAPAPASPVTALPAPDVGADLEAAWELELWRRREEAAWMEELKGREARRMVGGVGRGGVGRGGWWSTPSLGSCMHGSSPAARGDCPPLGLLGLLLLLGRRLDVLAPAPPPHAPHQAPRAAALGHTRTLERGRGASWALPAPATLHLHSPAPPAL